MRKDLYAWMHDSMWFSVPYSLVDQLALQIKAIATQERLINGRRIPFPASFKVMYDDGHVEKL